VSKASDVLLQAPMQCSSVNVSQQQLVNGNENHTALSEFLAAFFYSKVVIFILLLCI